MKTILTLIIATAIIGLTGCASFKLPAITAEELSYHRTDPIGGTQITAKKVKVTEGKVKAEEATWTTQYPSWTISVQVKGYERKLTKKEANNLP